MSTGQIWEALRYIWAIEIIIMLGLLAGVAASGLAARARRTWTGRRAP